MYLPSVGLAAATGWLVIRLARDRPRAARAGLVLVLVLGGVRTWTRTPAWHSNPTVFANLIGDHPQSGRSQWILGDEFLRVEAESEALRAYSASIGILGQDYQLLTEIAMRLIGTERYRLSEFLLRQAIAEDSSFTLAPALVAVLRAEQADPVGTERFARMAIARAEDDGVRWHLLAWALAAQGRWDEAEQARERAEAEIDTGFWQSWMYLAYVRRHDGNQSGALAAVDSAWERVATDVGRVALDSVRVADFGLPPMLDRGSD